MRRIQQLVLFGLVFLTLAFPFVRTAHSSAIPNMDALQSMPTAISDCVSACTASNSLPLNLVNPDPGKKQKEREPSPALADYWRMFNVTPLEDLYILLPIVFLLLLYKDPKRQRAIPLRF